MPSYGPFSATTVVDTPGGYSFPWVLGTAGCDNNDSVSANISAAFSHTDFLDFGGYGAFGIPATQVITSFTVSIQFGMDFNGIQQTGGTLNGTINWQALDPSGNILASGSLASPVLAGAETTLTQTVSVDNLAYSVVAAGFRVRVWFVSGGSDWSPSYFNYEVDCAQVSVTTAITLTSRDVTLTGVVGTGGSHRDVTLTGVVKRDTATDVTLTAVVGLALEITSPAEGATVTSAAVTFQWLLVPGPQSDYRLRVYTDSALTELVYDSGVVGSALQQHTVPAGALPSPDTLYATVRVTTTGGATGTSPTRTFATSFATSVNVTGVASDLLGGCVAPTLLPGIRISWTQVTPGAGETFVSYDIRRRESGETLYTRIAQVLSIGTTYYDDYQVESRTAYEYMVVWQAQNGASTLISNNQSAPEVALNDFEFNWLHDPDDGFGLRIDGWAQNVALDPDVRFVQPWGRTVPTAHWGTAFGHKFNLTLHPQLLKNRDFWRDLETLMSRKTALCLRFGRAGELYFVAIARGQKQQAQAQFEPSLELTEIYYDEAV